MKVYLASDHAGYQLKKDIFEFLKSENYSVEDCGDFTPSPEDDYPLFISKAAEKVSEEEGSMGVVFGKSGAGEEIVANKFNNIRAVFGFNEENVKLAREDNDANILSLGSEFVDIEKARELVKLFLTTPFSKQERHERRIEEIKEIEKKQ